MITSGDFWRMQRKAEGTSILKYRQEHRISRGKVADRLGISIYALTRFEKGMAIQGRKDVSRRIYFALAAIVTDKKLQEN
jgi:transcriptional regulator with XRE-family HTH domain